MGWCSATEIFDAVAGELIDNTGPKDPRACLKKLVKILEESDWDCQCESAYYYHPMVQSIMLELHPSWFDENNDEKPFVAMDASQYFINQFAFDEGNDLSNLKLQKLLYFAQGLYLATYDTPLFNDMIEAWALGPVVPNVYEKYANTPFQQQPLEVSTFPYGAVDVLDYIIDVYGIYTEKYLRTQISENHTSARNISKVEVIPLQEIKDLFKGKENCG